MLETLKPDINRRFLRQKNFLMKLFFTVIISLVTLAKTACAQGNQISQIAAGTNHSLYKCMDNMVYAFGDNSSGQLGTGSLSDAPAPVQVNINNVSKIAASGFHTLFLKNDGTVWACGWNFAGQLGDSTNTDRSTPVQVLGLTNIVDIAAGQYHSIFVKDDGTVWTCGDNITGQLGDGTTNSRNYPAQVLNVSNAIGASGGTYHTLLLLGDNTVMSCGGNYNGQLGTGDLNPQSQPVSVAGLSGIVQVSCGSTHSLFLKTDGTVFACGSNNYGELALQTSVDTIVPSLVNSLTNIIEISAGYSFSLFLKDDGTVYSSGLNSYGQLGNGSNTTTGSSAASPVQNLNNVNHIKGGASHAIFLQGNGGTWTCGSNSDGQLGDNGVTLGSSFVPTPAIDACVLTSTSQNKDEANIHLFHNPINSCLQIETTQNFDNQLAITIYDVLGNVVNQTNIRHNVTLVDLSLLPGGIYVYRITGDKLATTNSGKFFKSDL